MIVLLPTPFLPWKQAGEGVVLLECCIPHKKTGHPDFPLSPLLMLNVGVSSVLMPPRKPFMEILVHVLCLGNLSSALDIGQHFRRREENSCYLGTLYIERLVHYIETKHVIYQISQIEGLKGAKQSWVQAKNIEMVSAATAASLY